MNKKNNKRTVENQNQTLYLNDLEKTDFIIEHGLYSEFEYPDDDEPDEICEIINNEVKHNAAQILYRAIEQLYKISKKDPVKLYIIVCRILNVSDVELNKNWLKVPKKLKKPLTRKNISDLIISIKKDNPELAKLLKNKRS